MTGSTRATMMAAFFRSFLSVVATFIVAFGTIYLMLDNELAQADVWRISVITGLVTAAAPFATRAGVEGAWDARRQQRGDRTPADVTGTPT